MQQLIPVAALALCAVACNAPRSERLPGGEPAASTQAMGMVAGTVTANGSVDAGLRSDEGATRTTVADTVLLRQGKEIVSTICAACHTEQPPPKLAPPLAHISQRYRMMVGDREQAIARITAWIKQPAKERSLMPPMAIERFGIMAPLPLTDEQRLAAATYLWSLSEGTAGMPGMRGMQGRQGMPGMPAGRDTSKMKDTTDVNRR